jgi:hypothetical protein
MPTGTKEIQKAEGGWRLVHVLRRHITHKCGFCSALAHFQCDYPMGEGKTCDKHLCLKHATRVGVNRDFCPEHVKP